MNASWKNVVGMWAVSLAGGWACAASVAQAQEVCTTITFDEVVQGPAAGFNGQPNEFLISADGQYRVEAFTLDAAGHFHLNASMFGGLCEQNHNPSGSSGNVEGLRITRVDGQPFTLESMDLQGGVSIGFLVNSTSAMDWKGFRNTFGATVFFDPDFVDVDEIFLADPNLSETPGDISCWDNIVLCSDAIPNPDPPSGAVAVDIHPSSCPNPLNIKSGGMIPVAICGTAGLDVRDIDPESITLMGVPASRYAYEDVATPFVPFVGKQGCLDCTEAHGDGILDLTLKFRAKDVLQMVALCYGDNDGQLEHGACLVLTLDGKLIGGAAIHGEDVVKIVGTRQRPGNAKKKK